MTKLFNAETQSPQRLLIVAAGSGDLKGKSFFKIKGFEKFVLGGVFV